MFGIRPVGFDSHDIEAMMFDHMLCDLGADGVELGGAMGGIPNE
jgi:methylmalonyl-CoA mutase cobalamin-binding subunit